MELSDLTSEQIKKAKACTGASELVELAKAEGMELTDEQLDGISGGWAGECDGYHCNDDHNFECNRAEQ